MSLILQFAAGLLFGIGLLVSGMANPNKVIGFLDLARIPAGSWDPSLAFVMAGAVAVTFIGYRLAWRRPAPIFAAEFDLPKARRLDKAIIVGPVIFGIGWGLAGICPGPALVLLGTAGLPALCFVASMLTGMFLARRLSTTRP
jgi:uncharacterized membrane protein YedE/YeeE